MSSTNWAIYCGHFLKFQIIYDTRVFSFFSFFLQMVESHHAYKCGIVHCNGALCDIPSVSHPKDGRDQFDRVHAGLRNLDSYH